VRAEIGRRWHTFGHTAPSTRRWPNRRPRTRGSPGTAWTDQPTTENARPGPWATPAPGGGCGPILPRSARPRRVPPHRRASTDERRGVEQRHCYAPARAPVSRSRGGARSPTRGRPIARAGGCRRASAARVPTRPRRFPCHRAGRRHGCGRTGRRSEEVNRRKRTDSAWAVSGGCTATLWPMPDRRLYPECTNFTVPAGARAHMPHPRRIECTTEPAISRIPGSRRSGCAGGRCGDGAGTPPPGLPSI